MKNQKPKIRFVKKAQSFLESSKDNILKSASQLPNYNDEPKTFSYIASIKDASSNTYHDEAVASGVAFEKDNALAKLFGEILERYAITVQPNKTVFGTYENLVKKGLNPVDINECNPYSDDVFKRLNKNVKDLKKEKFHWVLGQEEIEGKKAMVPAQLVFLPFKKASGEPVLEAPLSTGAAGGDTREDAVYGGACEVIERDSYMLSYLLKLTDPYVDFVGAKDIEISKLPSYFNRYNLELRIINTTRDLGVPSVAALVVDRTGLGPALSIGLKAGFNVKDIIIGSIEEALMVRNWIRDKFIYYEPDYKKHEHIYTVEERAYCWFDIPMLKKIDFWLENTKLIKYEDFKNKFESNEKNKYKRLVSALMKKGVKMYTAEVQTKKMKENKFFVVKTIIPSLQPMYLDEQNRYWGKKRLSSAAKKMGTIKINNIPHPFL
jgi:ribosomal protein S12 methylthiotransferase accessory factor